jgi:hypothetical protein
MNYDEFDLTEAQVAYIEFLCDPDRGTKRKFSKDHGVNVTTMRYWEQQQPRFRKALQMRMDELNLSPDRTQQVLNNMFRLASTGSDTAAVNAAKTYLQHIERLAPDRKPIEDRKISQLTKEELRQQLEQALGKVQLREVS